MGDDQKNMQWLMRLTFVVWLVHFYVFDASMIVERPIAFLAIAVVVLTLMTSFGLIVSIARIGSIARMGSIAINEQHNQFSFQPIAQSAFFAAILLISLFSADQTKQYLQQEQGKLSQQTSLTIHPSILTKLNTVSSNKQGELFARMIYRSHSVIMPYQLEQKAVFYTPNEQDINAAKQNRQRIITASRQHDQLDQKLKELQLLFYGQLILIFLSLCVTLVLLHKQKTH